MGQLWLTLFTHGRVWKTPHVPGSLIDAAPNTQSEKDMIQSRKIKRRVMEGARVFQTLTPPVKSYSALISNTPFLFN
jgi:hypothetical protein